MTLIIHYVCSYVNNVRCTTYNYYGKNQSSDMTNEIFEMNLFDKKN